MLLVDMRIRIDLKSIVSFLRLLQLIHPVSYTISSTNKISRLTGSNKQ
jgi:hypothetical protein